jgi:hypothetical protein
LLLKRELGVETNKFIK